MTEMVPPERFGELLRAAFREMEDWIERQIRDSGLRLSHWLTLKYIADGRICFIGDVYRELGITDGASTRLIDHLEQKGLVRRNRSRKDRRLVAVALQPEGERMVRQLRLRIERRWQRQLGPFCEADRIHITTALIHLIDAFRSLAAGENEASDAATPNRDRLSAI
ncbi:MULTISPECIES: MarR family winged helix-turn-helix transcriptional regulator [Sphingomonadales]|nr:MULTISPECIES: MarR family winged helix-turn-helix transcriptional regulator [Sphingomonadaceae]MBB4151247.1 DNA-binding MarR family transcriptional regulator [Sphingobium scionense]